MTLDPVKLHVLVMPEHTKIFREELLEEEREELAAEAALVLSKLAFEEHLDRELESVATLRDRLLELQHGLSE